MKINHSATKRGFYVQQVRKLRYFVNYARSHLPLVRAKLGLDAEEQFIKACENIEALTEEIKEKFW